MNPVFDLSIPLEFGGTQPNHFGAAAARAEALVAGSFTGDTRRGGSCNCATLTLTPHCNGTHTETVWHLTDDPVPANAAVLEIDLDAVLVTVTPERGRDCDETTDPPVQPDDLLVTRRALVGTAAARALIVRTQPNDTGKRSATWGERPAPFFTNEAMAWVVEQGYEHLLFDGPSLDRPYDEGKLSAHHIFWGLPARSRDSRDARRAQATITEMIYVPDAATDGRYTLSLQLAPFVSDATPSRPLIRKAG
jgi:kynurenine formamidase